MLKAGERHEAASFRMWYRMYHGRMGAGRLEHLKNVLYTRVGPMPGSVPTWLVVTLSRISSSLQ